MIILETVVVAFSMFSALPMPQVDWSEKNMKYALCAFPLIGAVAGLLCWGWAALSGALSFPPVLRGAGFCLLPVLLTGGIHLDGFADTCDALASHGAPEKLQEILKDPHLGAFAAIKLCCYFAASLALWASLPVLDSRTLWAMGLGFCLSRALSGLAVASFPLAKNTGLAHTFASAANKRRTGVFLCALAVLLAIGLVLCGVEGIGMAAAAVLTFLYYRRMAMKRFGGLSGDLAGWFLQTAELWMLGALVFCQYFSHYLLGVLG